MAYTTGKPLELRARLSTFACEELGDDPQMKACADACRTWPEACRSRPANA